MMYRIRMAFLVLGFLGLIACGSGNILESFESRKPEALQEAATFLEEGKPERAQAILLERVPEPTKLILQDSSSDTIYSDISFSSNLASSMEEVADGPQILSMYANAEAQVQGVNSLNILVDIAQIDSDLKSDSSSLAMTMIDAAGDEAAIATFGPAMPAKCKDDSATVNKSLDKAVAIILAAGILLGFDSSDLRQLRASLPKADLFNAAIFAQVNVICPVIDYDLDEDKKISESESTAITDTQAEDLYQRIVTAIDYVQALVDKNPGNDNLDKALTRMNSYKSKVDEQGDELSLANKIRLFLVSQSQ